jgi:hypothetical protein
MRWRGVRMRSHTGSTLRLTKQGRMAEAEFSLRRAASIKDAERAYPTLSAIKHPPRAKALGGCLIFGAGGMRTEGSTRVCEAQAETNRGRGAKATRPQGERCKAARITIRLVRQGLKSHRRANKKSLFPEER